MNLNEMRDYLSLSRREFKLKYSNNYKQLIDEAKTETFQAPHILANHRELFEKVVGAGGSKENAESQLIATLQKKKLSQDFIDDYVKNAKIKSVGGVKIESIENVWLPVIIDFFKYEGKELTLSDLKSSLDLGELILINREQLENHSENLIGILEEHQSEIYEPGIKSLLEKINNPPETSETVFFSTGDLIDSIDPKLTEDRKMFYDYWRDKSELWDKIVKTTHDVLKTWDKVEDITTEDEEGNQELGVKYLENIETQLEEFEDELMELEKMFQVMKKMNYIIETPPIEQSMFDARDNAIERNVSNLIMHWYKTEFFPEAAGFRHGEMATVDSSIDSRGYDVRQKEEESGEITSTPSGYMEDSKSIDDEDVQLELDTARFEEVAEDIKRVSEVDPLYALAMTKGLFKRGGFTKDSFISMKEEIETQIEEAAELDEKLGRQLLLLLKELDEIENEISVMDRDTYHVPLTHLMGDMLKQDTKQIHEFHKNFLKIISRIIEPPGDSSNIPLVWEFAEFGGTEFIMGDGEKRVTEQDKKERVMIPTFRLGYESPARPLGKFANSITDLLDLITQYYVEPGHSAFLPFKEKPEFLHHTFLTSLKLKGADSLIKTLETMFYSVSVAAIDKTELTHINNLLETFMNPKSDISSLTTNIKRVLEVLSGRGGLLPQYRENDRKYFAYILKQIADKNDENIENINFDEYPVVELAEQFDKTKHHSSFLLLHKLLDVYREQFLKNHYIKRELNTYYSLVDNLRNKLLMSEQTKILDAHDEIRKMLGKPIYYNNACIDSFENVSDTIDIIKSEYNVNLTATDIKGVVEELDSMNSIAKKYGTHEEVVYRVKAMFR